MKYKLIDILSSTEKVEFGTCDLCMYIGDLTTESYVFEDEKGEKITIEGGAWNWGDYMRFTYVDVNVIDFADYISGLDIKDIYAEFPSILSEFGYTLDEEDGESIDEWKVELQLGVKVLKIRY